MLYFFFTIFVLVFIGVGVNIDAVFLYCFVIPVVIAYINYIFVYFDCGINFVIPSMVVVRSVFLNFNYKNNFFFFTSPVVVYFCAVLSPIFLRWKPLFRKNSYFGLYRISRNKWLNNENNK